MAGGRDWRPRRPLPATGLGLCSSARVVWSAGYLVTCLLTDNTRLDKVESSSYPHEHGEIADGNQESWWLRKPSLGEHEPHDNK